MYLPPREDVNAPDMYIPVMAFVTYILLSTILAGLHGTFHPVLLSMTFSTAIGILFLEIGGLKLVCYLLSIPSSVPGQSNLLDLIAYSGYKFVGIIFVLLISEIFNAPSGGGSGGWVGWILFLYTFLANGLFLLRSLKYVLLPDTNGSGVGSGMGPQAGSYTVARAQKNRRTQFLFFYAYVVQFLFMYVLSSQEPAKVVVGGKSP
jgi:protein transport protein YIF1